MDEGMLDALRRNSPSEFTAAAKKSRYYQPLEQCALEYAKQGLTSLDEVFRISATLEDAEHRKDIGDLSLS